MSNENSNIQADILTTLLSTPHGEYHDLYPVHQRAVHDAPLFAMHLAPWYFEKGDVRDHKVLMSVALSLSTAEGVFDAHRDVGAALLSKMNPRLLERAARFMSEVRRGEKLDNKRFYYLPRTIRREINAWVTKIESDFNSFDRAAVHHRQALRGIYQGLMRVPGGQKDSPYNQVLFGTPPEDTVAGAVRKLRSTSDPAEQAELIVQNNIPFPVALPITGADSPSLVVALVGAATPMQVLHNVATFKKYGAFSNPDTRQLILDTVEKAKGDKRFVATRVDTALAAADVDEGIAGALKDAAGDSLKSGDVITRNWAGFIDASGSMSAEIELAKQLFAVMMTATSENANYYLYAHDTTAYPITPEGTSYQSMQDALKFIRAGGGTSIGAPLAVMIKERQMAEMIVLVTDEGENNAPRFVNTYEQYVKVMGIRPTVIVVGLGRGVAGRITSQLQQAGIEHSSYQFTGDSYSFGDLMPILAQPSINDLVQTILAYPLPQRLAV